MATMLLSLGKQVTLLTDRRALEMNRAIVDEAVRTGELERSFVTDVRSVVLKKLRVVFTACFSFRGAEICDPIGHL